MMSAGQPPGDPEDGLLGIVVVNFGSAHLVERHLGRIRLEGMPVRVVVVDNYLDEAEQRRIQALCADRGWTVALLPDNRGFGAGVNAGVRAARELGCVTFLLLNPDAELDATVVDELRRDSLREPLSLITPRVDGPDGHPWFVGAVVHRNSGRIRSRSSDDHAGVLPWVTGACLVVHRDLWERMGGFDESYFLYWEDVDLSYRCQQVGGQVRVRLDLVARHAVGGTQGAVRGRAKSAIYYRFNCRNRLLFAARHLPRRDMVRWLWATPSVSWEILMRGGRRQLLHRPGLALAAARGAIEGVGIVLGALVGAGRRRAAEPAPAGPGWVPRGDALRGMAQRSVRRIASPEGD
jgi:GT2 family glycosyltransferase